VRIAVWAFGHPEYDDWVIEQAESEARNSGLVLGRYVGLVDERDTTGDYFHLFYAQPDLNREWEPFE
jgi:hypothetical protein